jgi:hypothetical protein
MVSVPTAGAPLNTEIPAASPPRGNLFVPAIEDRF